MKYTIVINQLKAVELGLDLQQVLLITCVHELLSVSQFTKNEKSEVFITHSIFLEEYPLLGFKDRTVFFRKLKALEEDGYITKTTERIGGNKTRNFYGLTEKSDALFFNTSNVVSGQRSNVAVEHTGKVVKNQPNHYTNIIILDKYIDFCNQVWGKRFRKPSRELKAIVKQIEEEKFYSWQDFEHVVKVANIKYYNKKEGTDYRNLVSPFRKSNFETLLNLPIPRERKPWEDYTANQFLALYNAGKVEKEVWKEFKDRKVKGLPLCKSDY